MTATVTTDFREEFEAERLHRLRRRFLWYTGAVGSFHALHVLTLIIMLVLGIEAVGWSPKLLILTALVQTVHTSLFVVAFLYVFKKIRSRQRLLQLVYQLIVASGLLAIIVGPVLTHLAVSTVVGDVLGAQSFSTSINGSIASVLTAHLAASLFIPWTPREAVRPLVPLLVLFTLMTLIFGGGALVWRLVWIAGSPLIGVPGVTWCAWRAGRFRDRFHSRVLRRTYKEMKRELVDARHIHEDLFPEPILDGAVRFVYRYEPMRQIGGDFLYAHRFPGVTGDDADEPLSIVMIDVTGHGIPAALTVNRIYGELERLFAEDPDISPGDVLTSLNSYVHYTLATHSVYATALCVRVDPGLDLLEWASGGHPPAFVRAVDGRLERLDSTSFVLGACHAGDFHDGEQSMPFARGDTLIAYTDGAIEARDATGRMPGVEGFQRWIVSMTPDPGEDTGWASALLRAVERHRSGPPEDDTLIVELYRPLRG